MPLQFIKKADQGHGLTYDVENDNGTHAGTLVHEREGLMFWPSVQKPNWSAAELQEVVSELIAMEGARGA